MCLKKKSSSDHLLVLTGAIEACGNGVQEGVLWGQEALHDGHLDPEVGQLKAGCFSHHLRSTAGSFQGVSAGVGDFRGDRLVQSRELHIYST